MSLTGKSPADTYKDITYVDNSNSGVDSIGEYTNLVMKAVALPATIVEGS